MIIKCPHCNTGYNIPHDVLNKGPRKLKCAKCKNTFAVTKRSSHPPPGYMEFTGAQQLPPEFAFLKASAPPKENVPAEIPMKDEPVIPKEDVQRPTQGGSVPVRTSLPAESMFGGGATNPWEAEAPLELGEYPVSEQEHHGNQLIGKVFFGVIVLLIGFFVFVAMRNGWSISLSELPEQIAFAFSSEPTESLPDEVKNIDVSVVSKKVVLSNDGTAYLSVSGEVINNNPGSRSKVIIRGKLYDSKGNIRAEARMPCGRALDEKGIKNLEKGSVLSAFKQDGALYNCSIGPNKSTVFQVIFEDVPDDYDATFSAKLKAVAAKTP